MERKQKEKKDRRAPGKKKGRKREDDEEPSENESVADGEAEGESEDAPVKRELADIIEQLAEKRSSTRITALGELNEQLTSQFSPEEIQSRADTLQSYLANIIKKGDGQEIEPACRTICLVCLTLGVDGEKWSKSFLPTLTTVATNTAKSPLSRKSCVEAMGLIHFVASQEGQETEKGMEVFKSIFSEKKVDDELAAQAVTTWALLASSLPEAKLNSLFNIETPVLRPFLEKKSLEVRSAAGETLALLYSAHLNAPEKAKEGHIPDIEALTQDLAALATDSDRHRAKEARKKQRSLFREILSTFEEGDEPSQTLTIQKKKYEFVGWTKILQLNIIRSVLGTGFQLHLAQNRLLADIFELETAVVDGHEGSKSKVDKQVLKERAKVQYHDKQKSRKKKEAVRSELFDEL